jgi:hypothetical protein
MNLTDLFENKKEIKNRNPIAQELRANPQFKAKTEIDKKKEVKKGYQKHKSKVEEASGYQGQSEPTYHIFKNADIKKIVDIIKAKNLRAYPEKTADGVKVHTFDLDRSAVAKELGINETMDSEYKEVKAILDKHGIKSSEEIEIGTEAYEELFGYYMDSGEMPYGVMKARTGMPDEWIADRLDDLGLVEQVDYKTVDRFHKKLDKLVHKTFGHSSDEKKENIEVEENNMSTGAVGYGKKGKTRRATGINDNPYNHNEGEDHPALVNAALWNMKDIYQTIMAGEEIEEDDMFSYGDVLQYLDMSGIPGYDFYEDFIDTVSTAVSQAQPGGFAGQGDAVLVDKKFAPKIKTLYQQFKAATVNIKGIKEDLDDEVENESIKKTDYDNMLNVANRNKDNDIARMQKLAGIVPMQMQEDYAKMTHDLISKLIGDGKSDEEIQARTGETGKRIEAIRKSIEDDAMDRAQQGYKLARDEEPVEATQDLARGLNSVKPSVDTTMSPQLTAKGFDAIAKGDRLTPTQIKAVEPYVSKLSKAISNPQTAGAVKTAFNKVR